MYSLPANFDTKEFLSKHWQSKPLVIKGFFAEFQDPIDENDLAGIAQEEEADSRIVSVDENSVWSNTSGPFSDFETVCINKWSLLVQGVDRYIAEIDALFESFNFIPYWRMDDVMVSYSVAGAGVGAHIDQYDVFLIQGKGKRRWQIGEPGEHVEKDNNGLRQINDFEPAIDVITEAGDLVYIPPGWPHKGETLIDSLTYSIGFRAPDSEQLLNTLHDTLIERSTLNKRYTDSGRSLQKSYSQVSLKEQQALKAMLHSLIDSPEFDSQLMQFLSETHLTDIKPEVQVDPMQIKTLLDSGESFHRTEGVKPFYAETDNTDSSEFEFFIDGNTFKCESSLQPLIVPLLESRQFDLNSLMSSAKITSDKCLDSLCDVVAQLVNNGYWYIE